MNQAPHILRQGHIASSIVIVDGQPGCGKTMLSPIVAALERVELLTYAYEMEYICSLHQMDKIASDAAIAMMRLLTDLQMYNTMMSRETNFRPSDLSSVWNDVHPWRYIRRLFAKGDELIPQRIKEQKPILHLTTHNLLPMAEPVFDALEDRVLLIEVVRHPLYMVKQQALNMQHLIADVRDFTIYFEHQKQQLPYFAWGWQDKYIQSNDVEKAIYSMQVLSQRAELLRAKAQVMTIPFEHFVLDPMPFMNEMVKRLNSNLTPATKAMMHKQKVPRTKIADGLALNIYKRCGWQPPQANLDEKSELLMRRQFVAQNASREALSVMDELSRVYEQQYMPHILAKARIK